MSCGGRVPLTAPVARRTMSAMPSTNPSPDAADSGAANVRPRGLAERIYDGMENGRGLGQGTISMIAFLLALPIVVVVAHCLML